MRNHCIILSFLLMQTCIHCYVVNTTPERYEIINLPDNTNRPDWQNEYISAPEQARQNAWLKYLSEEFKRALNEDNTETQAQPQMYMEMQKTPASYAEAMMNRNANMDMEMQKTPASYAETMMNRNANMDMEMQKTPASYAETMMNRNANMDMEMQKTAANYAEEMMNRDENMDMDHTKVKKSARMNMQRFQTDYPQSFNYINKQVDVRAPETVFVTFPEHTQIVDEYGRVIRPTTTYLQAPQRYMQEVEQQKPEQPEMNEETSRQTEKKDSKKVAHKKSQEKHDMNTTEQNKTDEKNMDFEQKETDRKTKTKHDKKDKRNKQTKTKHAQETETEMKNSQEKHTDTKHVEEEEDMSTSSYTQNQSKYKTPIETTQKILLAKLNGPFAFGKTAI